jgi:hypothetical protein
MASLGLMKGRSIHQPTSGQASEVPAEQLKIPSDHDGFGSNRFRNHERDRFHISRSGMRAENRYTRPHPAPGSTIGGAVEKPVERVSALPEIRREGGVLYLNDGHELGELLNWLNGNISR